MSPLRRLALAAALLLPGAAHALTTLTSPGTLTICSAMNRPPMEFFAATGQPAGIDVDLGNALAAQMHLRPSWLNIPFTGLIPALRAQQCDIILAQLFIRPERLKVIDELPYMNAQGGFLVRTGAKPVATPAALAGQSVAAVTGTTSADRLAAANVALAASHQPLIRIVTFPQNTGALQALQLGQVDAYAVAFETGQYYAALRPDQFALGGAPYFKVTAGIGVTKGDAPLEAALTTALATLRANGTYSAIFARWHLPGDALP